MFRTLKAHLLLHNSFTQDVANVMRSFDSDAWTSFISKSQVQKNNIGNLWRNVSPLSSIICIMHIDRRLIPIYILFTSAVTSDFVSHKAWKELVGMVLITLRIKVIWYISGLNSKNNNFAFQAIFLLGIEGARPDGMVTRIGLNGHNEWYG